MNVEVRKNKNTSYFYIPCSTCPPSRAAQARRAGIRYSNKLDTVSPARLAPGIKIPVMLIHGGKDQRFLLEFALKLKRSFVSGQVELYVAEGVGHSDCNRTPGYADAVKSFLDRHLKEIQCLKQGLGIHQVARKPSFVFAFADSQS